MSKSPISEQGVESGQKKGSDQRKCNMIVDELCMYIRDKRNQNKKTHCKR